MMPPVCELMTNGIGDSEPTRNVKELHFAMYDWFTVEAPKEETPPAALNHVYTYGLEETQNFLGQITQGTSDVDGTGLTKNRIKSVTLDILSPEGGFSADFNSAEYDVALPLIVSAVPVPSTNQGPIEQPPATPDSNSLIGQNSTVVHPDVRRAWIQVAHWNWLSLFSDTQLDPFYSLYVPGLDPPGDGIGLELFRLGLFDSVTGRVLRSPEGKTIAFNFRVKVELAAPVGLIPTPTRFTGRMSQFAGDSVKLVDGAPDITPVQYQLKGLQNLI